MLNNRKEFFFIWSFYNNISQLNQVCLQQSTVSTLGSLQCFLLGLTPKNLLSLRIELQRLQIKIG